MVALAVSLAVSTLSVSASPEREIAELRAEMERLRADYQDRLQRLEARLQQAEQRVDSAPPPQQSSGRGVLAGTDAGRGRAASGFNPAISLVLVGSLTDYSGDAPEAPPPGLPTTAIPPRAPQGPSLGETELTLSANVDDWFYGQATLALHQDEESTEVDVEEAFIDTLSLPYGTGLRFGRFYSDIGYLNQQHPHAWDFADAPLPYTLLLGGQYRDDGLRLSWVAPTDLLVETSVEVLRGSDYPAGERSDWSPADAWTAKLNLGGDLGASHSWQLGISSLWIRPFDRGSAGHGHEADHLVGDLEMPLFSGDSRLAIVDLLWKWRPPGDYSKRELKLQGEYFYRDEDGTLAHADADAASAGYSGSQQGYYLQGVYRFLPAWRLGIRYDRVWGDSRLSGGDDELDELLSDLHDPERWSAMLDYSHSEYGRIRLQYSRDRTYPEAADVWTLQYIMSLGAHGAHAF